MVDTFPFLRITVLGLKGSGKTSLISSFVNNYFPTHFSTPDKQKTTETDIHYRTMRVQTIAENQVNAILVEIEDCCPGAPPDLKSAGQKTQAKSEEEEKYMAFLDISHDSSLSTECPWTRPPTGGTIPFQEYPAPECVDFELPKPKPLTKGRMGYLVVFDLTQDSSLNAARVVVDNIFEKMESLPEANKPVVYLVGNKLDVKHIGKKERDPAVTADIFRERELNERGRRFKFFQVSAKEATRVRKLFVSMVEDILAKPLLWRTESLESDEEGEQKKNQEECSVM